MKRGAVIKILIKYLMNYTRNIHMFEEKYKSFLLYIKRYMRLINHTENEYRETTNFISVETLLQFSIRTGKQIWITETGAKITLPKLIHIIISETYKTVTVKCIKENINSFLKCVEQSNANTFIIAKERR